MGLGGLLGLGLDDYRLVCFYCAITSSGVLFLISLFLMMGNGGMDGAMGLG